MERMPQELYDKVISYVATDSRLAPLAPISLKWQAAVEQRTFKEISLKSSDLDLFERACHGRPDRHQHIQHIRFSVELPAYPKAKRTVFENDSDRLKNNRTFTAEILGLLDILSSWKAEEGHVQLTLHDVYSVTDYPTMRRHALVGADDDFKCIEYSKSADDEGYTITDLYNWRHLYSFLDLDPGLLIEREQLPQVPAIREFTMDLTTRNIADHVPVILAAQCMPNVAKAIWRLQIWDIKYLTLRREYRSLLSQAVVNHFLDLAGLEELVFHTADISEWAIDFIQGDTSRGKRSRISPWSDEAVAWEYPLLQNNEAHTESAISPYGSHDNLSSALRIGLGQLPNLKRLTLGGTFDASLFTEDPICSVQEEDDAHKTGPLHATETWGKSLEDLQIELNVRRPQGGGYFWMTGLLLGRPGFDSDDDDYDDYYDDDDDDDDEPLNNRSTEFGVPPGYKERSIRDMSTTTVATATARDFDEREHTSYRAVSGFPVAVADDNEPGISVFLSAFARACGSMPMLKSSSVSTWLPACIYDEDGLEMAYDKRKWGVEYLSPGTERTEDGQRSYWFRDMAFLEDAEKRRVLWDTQGWRPSSSLREQFAQIGAKSQAGEFVEKFASLTSAQERAAYLEMENRLERNKRTARV